MFVSASCPIGTEKSRFLVVPPLKVVARVKLMVAPQGASFPMVKVSGLRFANDAVPMGGQESL